MTRRRARATGDEGEERWLLTYSDMITLLLALFVVLFALSNLNQVKFAEFRTGVRQAFTPKASALSKASTGLLNQTSLVSRRGITPPPQSASSPPATPDSTVSATATAAKPDSAQLAKLDTEIHSALAQRGLLPYASLVLAPSTLTVGLVADKVFFATNSDALAPVGVEVVNTVGSLLAPGANDVVVRGYTDNVPVVGGPYFSNFMLSAARATVVVLRLDHVDKVSAARLRAVGYGSTDAVATNATALGRSENRRVDIVIDAEGAPS